MRNSPEHQGENTDGSLENQRRTLKERLELKESLNQAPGTADVLQAVRNIAEQLQNCQINISEDPDQIPGAATQSLDALTSQDTYMDNTECTTGLTWTIHNDKYDNLSLNSSEGHSLSIERTGIHVNDGKCRFSIVPDGRKYKILEVKFEGIKRIVTEGAKISPAVYAEIFAAVEQTIRKGDGYQGLQSHLEGKLDRNR